MVTLPRFAAWAIAWHVFKIACATALAATLLIVDPFDLDRGVGERGRTFFYKIAGYTYPEQRSPRTFVVLLDDGYLEARELTWPLPYAAHAGVIEQIASRRPAAIFVDFTFIDPRSDEGLGYFVETLRRVAETVPIYIASGANRPGRAHARPEIAALEGAGVHFVSITLGADLGDGRGYPMSSSSQAARPAAVALYEDLCPAPGACTINPQAPEMDIWWGVRRNDDFNCRAEDAGACDRLRHGPLEQTARMLANGLGDFTPRRWRPLDPVPVDYAPTVRLSDLINGANADELRPRMEHAVVIYGSQLAFTGDAEISPVHGEIAGAQAHAMAYDNLVVLDGRYVRAPPRVDWQRKTHMVLLTCILAAAALLARILLTLRFRLLRFNPDKHSFWFNLTDAVVFLICGLIIAYIEFYVQRIGPMMWASVLAAAAAGNVLAEVPWASWVWRKALENQLKRSGSWS